MFSAFTTWFKALSLAGKTGVVTASVFASGTGLAAVSPPPEPEPQTQEVLQECKLVEREETIVENVTYDTKKIDDDTLEKGETKIKTKGVEGKKETVFRISQYEPSGCEEDKREKVSESISKEPTTEITLVGTYVAPEPVAPRPAPSAQQQTPRSNCDPNYSGCVPIASDVDCGGGSGNGPAYVYGSVRVIGSDIYDLDSDSDGYGCE